MSIVWTSGQRAVGVKVFTPSCASCFLDGRLDTTRKPQGKFDQATTTGELHALRPFETCPAFSFLYL